VVGVPGEPRDRRPLDAKTLIDTAIQPFLVPIGGLGLLALPNEAREAAARDLAEVFDVNPVVARLRVSQLYPIESQMQQLL
jgi:hypothetical protein